MQMHCTTQSYSMDLHGSQPQVCLCNRVPLTTLILTICLARELQIKCLDDSQNLQKMSCNKGVLKMQNICLD